MIETPAVGVVYSLLNPRNCHFLIYFISCLINFITFKLFVCTLYLTFNITIMEGGGAGTNKNVTHTSCDSRGYPMDLLDV